MRALYVLQFKIIILILYFSTVRHKNIMHPFSKQFINKQLWQVLLMYIFKQDDQIISQIICQIQQQNFIRFIIKIRCYENDSSMLVT